MTLCGRVYERGKLEKVYQSSEAEFVAVYGRRRVGKTYLIRTFFQDKACLFFQAVGSIEGELAAQLAQFKQEIQNVFYGGRSGISLSDFNNWHDAFAALNDAIELFAGEQKVVLFMDEIAWLAKAKSGMLEALEFYWNRYWVQNKNLKLIICGSAASWIIDNILNNTGGLHNRVTLRLPIMPFNLKETKEYLSSRNIRYNESQVLTLYMCIGGIPFYLRQVEKGLSALQNIHRLCFEPRGLLYNEYQYLFASLFKNHEAHEQLIASIAKKREGLTRREIEEVAKQKGGRLTLRLRELEEAGFIASYSPWGKQRGLYYRVIDEYSLFYLTWIKPLAGWRTATMISEEYWETLAQDAKWRAWSGYAFELTCYKHLAELQKALNIPLGAKVYPFRHVPARGSAKSGTQIDLVFERPDGVDTLCEIKYYQQAYQLDKQAAGVLQQREAVYKEVTKTNKHISHVLVAANGLKPTLYSESLIDAYATLEDLFK